MATGPKGSWGGRRPGSGPKKATIGEKLKKRLLKEMRLYEKDTGISLEKRLLDYAHGKVRGAGPREALAAMKIAYDMLVTKSSESNVNVTHNTGPSVYLPEERPDPAKLVVVK